MNGRAPRVKPDGTPARRVLAGLAAATTPASAGAFYAHPRWRHLALARAVAAALACAPAWRAPIDAAFAELHGRFRWRAEREDVWGNMQAVVRRVAGRWVRLLFGDCDDFAVWLLMVLVASGLPRGALRLCLCRVPVAGRPRAHLVLAIATAEGTLICDSLQDRPRWADDPAFDAYEWVSMEDPPARPGAAARWVLLRLRTLAEVWPGPLEEA